MGNELTTIQPGLMSEIEKMATAIANSGLFGIKTIPQATALLLISYAEGRHPALAARDYNIIQGRPSKTSEAMARDFLASGGKIIWHKLDDTIADATFSHQAGGEVRISWDMERVKKAKISNAEMYAKYPRAMLRSRTVSEGVRTVFPAATSGMYVEEEIRGFAQDAEFTEVKPEAEKPKALSGGGGTGKNSGTFEAQGTGENPIKPIGKKPQDRPSNPPAAEVDPFSDL